MLYYIDIVDACNLRCRTCVRGQRKMKNSQERMTLIEFKKILAKIKENGATIVGLFNWTEPFLHPEIHKFVEEIVVNDLRCILSSNLALSNMSALNDTLNAGVSELSVSVSGFTNEIYQINHSGGDVEVVKQNLTAISKYLSISNLGINVYVKYLEFDYNKDEIAVFKKFSESLGLNFSVHPAAGNPFAPIPNDILTSNENTVDIQEVRSLGKSLNPCELLFDAVALDYKGDVYLCCAYGNFENCRIGNYLEMNYEKMMLSRLFHPQCRNCSAFRRKPTNEDITNISRWFGKHFFGEDFVDLKSIIAHEQFVHCGEETSLEDKVADLNNSITIRDVRIGELDKQLADRDRQLGEILTSISWRISSPLRLIRKMFQRNS